MEPTGKALRIDRTVSYSPVPLYMDDLHRRRRTGRRRYAADAFLVVRRRVRCVRHRSWAGYRPSRPVVSSEEGAFRIRVPLCVDARDSRNDPSLFGSPLVWGLAGALSSRVIFSSAIAREHGVWGCLSASVPPAFNERARDVFSRPDAGPV